MSFLRWYLLIFTLTLASGIAHAQAGLSVRMKSFDGVDLGSDLLLTLGLELNNSLINALDGGMEIMFVMEMHVKKNRLFLDKELEKFSWTAGIQRRTFGHGYTYRPFGSNRWHEADTSKDAFTRMSELRLHFDDQTLLHQLESDPDLYLNHRVEIDLTGLPNPLQVDLLTSSDWSFSSGWQRSRP